MPRGRSGARAIDERAFHSWLAAHLAAGRSGLLPLGDDAAALRPPRGAVAVLTTDALAEGTHFLRDSDPGAIGAAAVAVSLSDLAAKGATPAAILLAVLVPPGTPSSWAARVVRGAERTARRYGAAIVGGDTKPGRQRAVVGFALGWGRPDRLSPRTGAEAGDLLVLTGTVGRGGLAAARRRTGAGRRRALADLLAVEPRVAQGRALARYAHAMLDTSDGLAEAARLLAAASRQRIVVEAEALPLAPGIDRTGRPGSAWERIAFFGGDYELLATLPRDRLSAAQRAVHRVGGRLTSIGVVTPGRGAVLREAGRERPMPETEWQPFRSPYRRGRS